MAFVSQQKKADLAPAIKAVLKKYGIKGTVAVRHHSTLVLNIKSGKIDFIKNYNDVSENRITGYGDPVAKRDEYIDVNPFWFHEHFTGDAKDFLTEVIAAMKGPEFFDHSDAMTDYFHTSHYIDVNIGAWNKPYIFSN